MESQASDVKQAEASLQITRVIYAALMGGVVFVTALGASGIINGAGTGGGGQGNAAGAQQMEMAFVVLSVVMPLVFVPAAFIARGRMMANAVQTPDPLQARVVAAIMSGAMLEGMGLLGGVMWMITGTPLPGVILAALAIGGLGVLFPKRREFVPEGAGDQAFARPETWT